VKVLLDADVLLDVALQREAFAPASYALLRWCQERPRAGLIAWHSVANVYYVLRRAQSDSAGRRFIADLLQFCDVTSGGTEAVRHALAFPMSDFEDALQVVAAVSAEAEWIVSRNLRHYRGSPVRAVDAQDFLARVSTS
jgi:predicted nucleic acid-binding protein